MAGNPLGKITKLSEFQRSNKSSAAGHFLAAALDTVPRWEEMMCSIDALNKKRIRTS